ncbi:hypothetical protein ACB098_01G371800 [Castanea mollissima]
MEEMKSAKTEIRRGASTSIEIQHQCTHVVNEIQEMLKHLESPLSLESCIYRVPDYLRKLKEEHYTPQVISIGPFHHDANDKLRTMEQRKLRYLKYFIERVENFDISLEDLVRIIKENEESIRCCYAETIHLDSDHFVKIITMDAIFILELFWRDFFNDWMSEDNGARLETWLISAIRFDLILLENQLPFFILEKLFDYAFASHPSYSKSLIQVMTFYYFDYYNTQCISYSPHLKMKHFLDLLRTFWLPPSEKIPKRGNDVIKHLHSATQLREAGLAFKKDPSSCLLDIKFTKGALRMPPLTLDNSSETIIRNLLALEQCHYSDKAYITDYFILFGFLINTNKDVDLLVRKGVMLNLLGNSGEARNLVNSLVENVIYVDMNSNFYRVCKDLKAFYKKPWNRWHATLRRDYFSSPWSIASTVVAFIFLVLTLLQTIYTIKW